MNFKFNYKIGPQHGIVFCKNNLDINTPYIEFKINMNIPCRGKSHLFIGLVDKTKYKIENLSNINFLKLRIKNLIRIQEII